MSVVAIGLLAIESSIAGQGRTLDIYWIDVEGGAATLIVTPVGESILIDTGYPGDRGAPRIHKVASGPAGLKRIEYLVITHFHNDHVGGAADLAALMPIGQVQDNGTPSPPPSEKDAPIFAAYQKAFPRRRLLNPGDTLEWAQVGGTPHLSLRLLGTRQKFVAAAAGAATNPECQAATLKPDDTSDNANSTAWVLELGSFRFFDAGDLTWNAEARVACPVNLAGGVDVYQVTHHGLDMSNNPVLVRSLAPTVAIMNNGARKGTEPQTVALLKSLPSIRDVYQGHKNLRDDKQNAADDAHIANLEEQCQANYIKMSVDPTGKSYTIEIPATKYKRTYTTRTK
jgi:beta-lactamase superfamily II metal-dependent hydrolase